MMPESYVADDGPHWFYRAECGAATLRTPPGTAERPREWELRPKHCGPAAGLDEQDPRTPDEPEHGG